MKLKWLAIYQKFPPGQEDPLDFEVHGWEVEAASPGYGLEILEERMDVPWRTFLVEVIPFSQLEEWQRDLEPRHKVKLHRDSSPISYDLHGAWIEFPRK